MEIQLYRKKKKKKKKKKTNKKDILHHLQIEQDQK